MEDERIYTYQEAAKIAKQRGLILAEYGDGADYSDAEAYCYWNRTGNRNHPHEIYIEYDFDKIDENTGRKTLAGTEKFSEIHPF